jgi:hypothetical protein
LEALRPDFRVKKPVSKAIFRPVIKPFFNEINMFSWVVPIVSYERVMKSRNLAIVTIPVLRYFLIPSR